MFGNRMKVGNIEIASFDFTFTFGVALAWSSAVEENRYIATGQWNFKGFKYGREIFIGILMYILQFSFHMHSFIMVLKLVVP